MSQPNSSGSNPCSSAILAPVYARRAKKKKAAKPQEALPWARLAIYGAIAFQAVVVVIGLYYVMFAGIEPIADDLPPVPVVKQVAQEPFLAPPNALEPLIEPLPELPPKAAVLPPKAVVKQDFVECARIGTDVRFLKDPTEAFKRAKAEKKMVFMVHLSGNLEDREFT